MEKQKVKGIIHANEGSFDYGSVITENVFCFMFGVKLSSDEDFIKATDGKSKNEIKKLIEDEELNKLSCFGVVLDILHEQGKHIYRSGRNYVVALPSQNETIAEKYIKKAMRAHTKAKKLLDNSPYVDNDPTKKTNAKSLVHMLGNSI